jgi:predicted RNA-binding protein YlqC (UPF0109 family)
MENSKDITEAVATLIKLMVDRPENVTVECIPVDSGASLRISVDPLDVGKIIGRQGRTARSLRVLVAAMGMATKLRIGLDIKEQSGPGSETISQPG